MLTIRREQMEALEAAAVRDFERRMLAHLRQFFPKHLAVLGEPTLRAVIRFGVGRGSIHGFTTEHDLCLYVDLMLLLGSLFDEDPQLPWADAILHDAGIPDSAERAERLYDEAMAFLDDAAGEDGQYLTRALVTLHKHPLKETWAPGPGKLEDRLLAHLRALWPQKYECVGAGPLGLMVHRGVEGAARNHVAGDFGALVFVVLMFFLGSGFDRDPQYPWALAILGDASPASRAARAQRLDEASRAHLNAWMART